MTPIEKYVLTIKKFEGSVIYGFSAGNLVLYHNESNMDSEALAWFYDRLPLTPEQLRTVVKFMRSKGTICQLEIIPPDISFEAFWNGYGKKVNKLRAAKEYKKLTDPERTLCIISLKPYDDYLRRMNGRAKLDPENYLKRRSFENPWSSLNS
ncbi:MAG: hypothetical protein RIC03_06860 [Cyclobacteriaceae bacterium]